MVEHDISVHDYPSPYDIKYKITDRLLRLWMKLQHMNYKCILDAVVNCLMSSSYLNAYESIDLHNPILTPKQSLFLYQCPKFIRLMSYERQEAISHILCEKILSDTNVILRKYLPVILGRESKLVRETNKKPKEKVFTCIPAGLFDDERGAKMPAIAWNIELLNYFALTSTIAIRSCFYTNHDRNETMVDQMLALISEESLIKSVKVHVLSFHADVALMSYSLVLLYNLVFDETIHRHIKDKKPFDALKELYVAKDKVIQFTSRTLAAILRKDKIDKIDNPAKIAKSYLYLIENTLEDPSLIFHGIKLDGVLTNLETVVQNDDVKEEIVNEDGINLIGDIAYREDLDEKTIRDPTIRIIEGLSFAKEGYKKILENERLSAYLDTLLHDRDAEKRSIAKYINWNVKDQNTFIKDKTCETESGRAENIRPKNLFDINKAIYQYVPGDYKFRLDDEKRWKKINIRISCSQQDQKICNDIYNKLMESDLYNVSFDTSNSQRPDPEVLANEVERSSVVIICASNTYQNSYPCRIEAVYAKKRNRKIIAVKFNDYIPSKWLTRIIEEEPIVFTPSKFNEAWAQLHDTINKE
ncbi:hypothetical protein I4U23_012165 [Adineta vaga]|nr:hypothetical protein I4U23_012165 [Adineta vaga]